MSTISGCGILVAIALIVFNIWNNHRRWVLLSYCATAALAIATVPSGSATMRCGHSTIDHDGDGDGICCFFYCHWNVCMCVFVSIHFYSVIQQSHPVCNTIMLFGIIICLLSVILLGIDGRFVSPSTYPKVWLTNAVYNIKTSPLFFSTQNFFFTPCFSALLFVRHTWNNFGHVLDAFACRYVKRGHGCFRPVLHSPMVQCSARYGECTDLRPNRNRIQRFVAVKCVACSTIWMNAKLSCRRKSIFCFHRKIAFSFSFSLPLSLSFYFSSSSSFAS